MRAPKNNKRKNSENERGAALIIAIFSILLVTVVAFALASSGVISTNISTNARQHSESYYIAEAGLNHAIAIMRNIPPSNYSSILTAGDGVANTCDELSTQPVAVTPIPAAGIAFGSGRYTVCIADDPADSDGNPNADSNNRLVIRSIGMGPDGSTSTNEAIIYNVQLSRPGMLADGDINVTNNLYVRGPDGSIHSNTTFNTNNPVCVDLKVSHSSPNSMNLSKISSGATCSTPGTVGTNVFYSQPRVTPEIHDVANIQSVYRPQADFIFKADGTIWRQGGSAAMTNTEITTAGLAPWSWGSSNKTWSYSNGGTFTSATYYFEGCNMKITNAGNPPTPPMATFVGEGSLLITNGPAFQPKLSGIAMVAGNDIACHSQVAISTNPGFVYAYGQIQITNSTTIYGWIQAANFRRADGTNGPDVDDPGGQNLVPYSSFGAIRISGVTNIYTPTPSGSGSSFSVISRREVRY